ncbi:MAG: D-alanyl-D-alanine carboxypeptidase/D-alanyl-D-alanine-endopeptidase [Saprospiraceae bacterium]|nr:D-alanyl-D-alanine carboxypeptidase/D-alanyl-D-alanine-endopeptidase [Saprospiraceae bacterium]
MMKNKFHPINFSSTRKPLMEKIGLLFTLFLLSQTAWSQSSLQQAINAFSKDPTLKHAGVGISVVDVANNKEIAQHDSQRSLVPASSLKVLTTSSALAMLGTEYRFSTHLQYTGSIDANGQLNGDLILQGAGDPTLGSPTMPGGESMEQVLDKFSMALQQKGIRKISGHVVGDASFFATKVNGSSWQWNDLGNYYGAGSWGLNFHDNLYYLRFQQTGRLGRTPRIAIIEPEIPNLRFTNEIKSASAGSGDNAYIYGAPYTYERFVRGTIPIGSKLFSIKGSIPDPPLFAAQQLATRLRNAGIVSEKGATSDRLLGRPLGSESQKLLTHRSPFLKEIVVRTNIKSVNLYCETLLRALGKIKGSEGTVSGGIKALQSFWEARGLSFAGVALEDGSGLSSKNVVTAKFMAQLMRKVARDAKIYDDFRNSLPIAGKSGGMSYTLRGTSAAGKVRAKTGTLNRVRSLTGYVETKSGKLLSFSIIVNNYTGSGGQVRKKMEKVLLAMYAL